MLSDYLVTRHTSRPSYSGKPLPFFFLLLLRVPPIALPNSVPLADRPRDATIKNCVARREKARAGASAVPEPLSRSITIFILIIIFGRSDRHIWGEREHFPPRRTDFVAHERRPHTLTFLASWRSLGGCYDDDGRRQHQH